MIRSILLLAFSHAVLAQWNSWDSADTSMAGDDSRTNHTTTCIGGVMLDLTRRHSLPMGIAKRSSNRPPLESFDAREHWKECKSVGRIRHQGCCGSCWAVSAAAAMTDRWCIHSENRPKFNFGAYDLIACCGECGKGCLGGSPPAAWEYWVKHGLTTGGEYNSEKGCHPYPFDKCHEEGQPMPPKPECKRQCDAASNGTVPEYERRYGLNAYQVPPDENLIMNEIYENGPVQGVFILFTDFYEYKSGVYEHKTGKQVGGHAMKIIGWGVEEGKKYWLGVNQWGPEWGENGTVKFLRGKNHLGIEQLMFAGIPSYR